MRKIGTGELARASKASCFKLIKTIRLVRLRSQDIRLLGILCGRAIKLARLKAIVSNGDY